MDEETRIRLELRLTNGVGEIGNVRMEFNDGSIVDGLLVQVRGNIFTLMRQGTLPNENPATQFTVNNVRKAVLTFHLNRRIETFE